jgi:hypothetical protein
MPKRYLLLLFVVAALAMTGCAGTTVVNVDGMPISNHEYNLTNDETGIRAVFVLTRYYREYEGDEYIVKPQYLDALHEERIDFQSTEDLLLHVKIVNLQRKYYAINWEINGPSSAQRILGHLYSGKLSRKDFFIKLPLSYSGLITYDLRITDAAGDDLYSLPQMRYKVKGGAKLTQLRP